MIGDVIKLDEPRSKSLAEPFHHTSDSGNIVVGGTDEGEKALNGVLSQESYTLEFLSHLLKVGVHRTPTSVQLSQADVQLEVLAHSL